MNNGVDDYLKSVIAGGDEMSSRLEMLFAPTLKNRDDTEILKSGTSGVKIMRPPKGQLAVVHSSGGDYCHDNPEEYTRSAFDALLGSALDIGSTPVAFADVIDSRTADPCIVMPYAHALVEEANDHKLAIMNGEFAVLGERMHSDVNLSLTMLSFIDPSKVTPDKDGKRTGLRFVNGRKFIVFDHENKPLYMNSDGVGTKMECYEREGKFPRGRRDSLAMKVDDAAKIGARVRAVSDVMEFNSSELMDKLHGSLESGLPLLDFDYSIQPEFVGDRIQSWRINSPAVNLSGSAVSILDEEFLSNPPKPSAGEYLIALRSNPNPRSNGITDKRKALVKMFGNSWHEHPVGKLFLDFVAQPSTIFYPLFRDALLSGAASSVYHMSGNAYNSKLARPLAKHNLYAEIKDLFIPDWRELALAGFLGSPHEVSYAKFPMGNEAFMTSQNPERALELIKSKNYDGKIVSRLEEAVNGRTGILLKGIRGSNGDEVYFSGK